MHPSRIRTMLVAMTLGLAVPSVAAAAADETPALKAEGKKRDKKKAHFPMAGDAFEKKVDSRLGKLAERLEARLAKAKMSDEKKREMREDFTRAAAKIR